MILLHNKVHRLQVLVERRGTIENLITTWLHCELVNHFVVILESLAGEGNHCLLGLTRLERHFLESLLDWTYPQKPC